MSNLYAVQIINGSCPMVVEVDARCYEILGGFVSFYRDDPQPIASFRCDVVDFVRLQVSEAEDE